MKRYSWLFLLVMSVTPQVFGHTPTVTFPILDDVKESYQYDDDELDRYWKLLDGLLIDEGVRAVLLEQLSGEEKLILLQEILG
ncbi:MAG: hypothetical protein OXC40_03700 [Proteobacteria bacterium]|nr:hypothetical protein [Pseudomonadota bacterium]